MPESLPLFTIRNLWAKVALMGHTSLYGLVSMVNIGSETCEVPMLLVTEPATADKPRELVEHESYGWCVLGAKRGLPEQNHYVGRQAVYEIEPVEEKRVLMEREQTRYPVPVGQRRQAGLNKVYRDALTTANLLTPGFWTEAHQAVIDAYDEAHPVEGKMSSSATDDYDFSDPFAEEEE